MVMPSRAMTINLRNRLLLLLVLPVCVLAVTGSWWGYRSAEIAAGQHDQRLLRLLPELAESVVAPAFNQDLPPVLAMTQSVDAFLHNRSGITGYAIADLDGVVQAGDPWISVVVPTTPAAEFHSQEFGGITYRVAVQRLMTKGAGELVMVLADGSDVRQQWRRQLLTHVLLPNMLLVVVAAWLIYWSVRKAFKPLLDLAQAVESRSPRDLSAIDESTSPREVRPLVHSLNRLFALVEAQSDTQRRFVADAAHQLRTPLAALQAQVEAWALMAGQNRQEPAVLQSEERSPASSHCAGASIDVVSQVEASQPAALLVPASQIEKLRQATRRTSQLAHQLLALSRADARHVQAQKTERVDLKELCENLLEAFWDSAAAKDIDLGLEVEPVHVSGQAWLLRELLSNLLDNAIKYTPNGGQVTVRCGRHSRAFLQVEDNGPGVPASERGRILERFYRIPGSGSEGSGLGLAIAQEIAQGHHATLNLSQPLTHNGLVVTLEFPE